MLFGLAINCESKNYFIEKIENDLANNEQYNLQEYIELVSENTNFKISKKSVNSLNKEKILINLENAIDERDSFLENIIELKRENVCRKLL